MQIIEVQTKIIWEKKTTIRLMAKFEMALGGDFDGAELEIRDWVEIGSRKPKEVFEEIDRIRKQHPFFKLGLCESPIELKFFAFTIHDIPGIVPQVKVGPYRVDLAIPNKRVAIELDGHEFHKTKGQRTDDAERQRYLQKKGWTVIRFTGTEIHRNVFKCITDAKEIIEKIPDKGIE